MPKNSLSLLSARLVEKNHLDEATADKFIKNLLDVINMGIQQDKLVKIKGWGTLKVISVRDRESIDVNTGERIVIEGRDKLNFAPDAILREIVNKPFEQFETVTVNDGVDFSPVDREFLDKTVKDEETEQEPVAATPATDKVVLPELQQEELKDTKEDENVNPSVVMASSTDEVNDQIPEQMEQDEPSEENTALNAPEESQPHHDSEDSSDNTPEDNTPEDNAPEEVEVEQPDHLVSKPVVETSSVKEEKENTLDQEQLTIEKTKTEALTSGTAAVDNHHQEANGSASNEKEDREEEKGEEEEEDDNSDSTDKEGQKVPTVKVFPRYLIFIAGFLFLVLIGGLVGLSYNYGRLVSECNQMALKLHNMETTSTAALPGKARKPTPIPHSEKPILKSGIQKSKSVPAVTQQSTPHAEQTAQPKAKQKAVSTLPPQNPYDSDPRIRTGAYRIVGIERVITVHKGQTLSGLSQANLGKGMECYVEAVNGIKEVKEGQKLRIPKLKLKKKR